MKLSEIELIVLRLSSCLDYIDTLTYREEENHIFVGKFKKDYTKFFDFFVEHSREVSIEIERKHRSAFALYVGEFDARLRELVTTDDEEKLCVFLLYCYCLSCQEALRKVDDDFCKPLFLGLGKLINGKYLRGIGFLKLNRRTVEKINYLYAI